MIRRLPRSTRTDTLFPSTTLFLSAGFGHLVVQNCTLAFSGKAFGENGQEVRIIRLDVEQRENGFEFDGRAQLPVTYGDVVELSADIDGPIGSAERRLGEEWISTCRSRGTPYHKKTTIKSNCISYNNTLN